MTSTADLLARTPETPAWRWEGYAAAGAVTALYAPAKLGKSTLLFGLLAAAQNGAPFLDRPTDIGGVLLLTEERPGTLREKAERFGVSSPKIAVTMRHDINRQTPWPDIVRGATAACSEGGINLLIVDTLASWAGLRGDAENSAGGMLEAVEPLQDAAGAGLAVIVVHHARKGSSDGPLGETMRGSGALSGAVDIIAELRPEAGRRTGRVLRADGRFEAIPPRLTFDLDLDTATYRVSGGTPRQAGSIRGVQGVVEWVAEHPRSTSQEIVVGTRMPRATVHRRLAAAAEAGTLTATADGPRKTKRWTVARAEAQS